MPVLQMTLNAGDSLIFPLLLVIIIAWWALCFTMLPFAHLPVSKRQVAIIVRWDFWHWFRMLTTIFFTCIFKAFINVSQHSQVNMCFCKSCSSMDWKWGWNILPESFLTCSYKEPCFEIIHTQGVALAVVPTYCSVTITT